VNRPQIDMSFCMLLGCRAHILILGAQAADRVIEASVRITSRSRLATLNDYFSLFLQVTLVSFEAVASGAGGAGACSSDPAGQ
jgi:hypothetical protein